MLGAGALVLGAQASPPARVEEIQTESIDPVVGLGAHEFPPVPVADHRLRSQHQDARALKYLDLSAGGLDLHTSKAET